ncbi:MAG: hypothetical protein ABIL01_32605 [Pseudomonadota bacterium]
MGDGEGYRRGSRRLGFVAAAVAVAKSFAPAPWELARLPPARQHESSILSRRCRRPALRIVVPEFALAVPIYDQRLPSTIADLSNAPWAERYALAIGVARVLNNPADTVVRILEACDAIGREKVMALIDRWPAAIRSTVDRAARHNKERGEGSATSMSGRFNRPRVGARSNRDAWRDRADA